MRCLIMDGSAWWLMNKWFLNGGLEIVFLRGWITLIVMETQNGKEEIGLAFPSACLSFVRIFIKEIFSETTGPVVAKFCIYIKTVMVKR